MRLWSRTTLEIEMNIEQLLLDALNTIKQNGPLWNAHGICDNITETSEFTLVTHDGCESIELL